MYFIEIKEGYVVSCGKTNKLQENQLKSTEDTVSNLLLPAKVTENSDGSLVFENNIKEKTPQTPTEIELLREKNNLLEQAVLELAQMINEVTV